MSEPIVYCTLPAVEKAMREKPLGGSELDPSIIVGATTEAHRLAERAYVQRDQEALGLVERILHVIHVNNNFDGPLQPLPAAMWATFLRRRMVTELAQIPVRKVSSQAEAGRILDGLVESRGAYNHPIWDALANDKSREALVIYVKNWFGSTHGFTAQLALLSQRAHGVLKKVVLDNLSDELMGKATHDEIRTKFITALGVTFDAPTAQHDEHRNTESFGLSSFRTGATTACDPSFALGSFYSIEANYPHEARRMLGVLRPQGFTEESLETFWMHVDADEDHAAEWQAAMTENLSLAELEQVVHGAEVQLEVRRRMFDAVYKRAYGKLP